MFWFEFLMFSKLTADLKVGTRYNTDISRRRCTMLQDQVKQAMKGLPKEAHLDELMYRLYILDRIEKAEAEADRKETMTLEDLREEVTKW